MSLLFEEIPFSPKLEVYRVNQDQIRNQRPRLHRNTLILGRKAGGGLQVYQKVKFVVIVNAFIYCTI